MAKTIKPTRSAPVIDTLTVQTAPAAFALVRSEIEAIPISALAWTNLDTAQAARRGLAVAERIEPLLLALAELPDFDFRAVSNLRCYALAVLHTLDLVTEGGQAAAAKLATLLEEAAPVRELLLHTAETLALAGYVSRERVAAIRSGKGHADTAGDLQTLGRLYLELWDRVRDKVPVTRAMVERAITLSAELSAALGLRELDDDDPLDETVEPSQLHAQAYTLFTRAYHECRRGVSYLRWHHGDAPALVPSLYVRRPRRSGAADETAGEPAGGGVELVEAMPEPEGDVTTRSDALVSA